MAGAHGTGARRDFPPGPRGGPAALGEDMFPSADRKSFHISTTRSTPGQKGRSPGSIPPNRVWKPQPHWVMDDWIGPMGLARGERCPPGQRRGPDAPGEDNFPSPDQTFFGIFTIRATRGGKRRTPGSIPVHRVWTPQPHWVIADWIGPIELARGEICPRVNAEVPPQPGRKSSRLRIRNVSLSLQLEQSVEENADPPGRYRPAGFGNANATG